MPLALCFFLLEEGRERLCRSPTYCAKSQKYMKINPLRAKAVHISTDFLTKAVDNSFSLSRLDSFLPLPSLPL